MVALPDVKQKDELLEKKILIATQKFTDEYPPIKTLKDIKLMKQSLSELVTKMRADAKTK